jgi:hypothetical protein
MPTETSLEEEPKQYLVMLNKFATVPTALYYVGNGGWVREYDEENCNVYTNVLEWQPMPALPQLYKEANNE